MAAGRRDRIVTIQSLSVVDDNMGGRVETWTDERDERASYNPGTGSERRIAGQEQSSLGATFGFHFNSLTSAIEPQGYRLQFEGAFWDIHSAVEIGRGRAVEVIAKRRVS